jgi:hypothetical protein
MNKAGWIVALILFVACVHLYTRQQAQRPQVTPGVVIQKDTVIVHDTLRSIISGNDIAIRKVPAPVVAQTAADTPRIDSAGAPSNDTAQDSAVCYSFSQAYASGAFVQAEMCSRFFPPVRPLDLAGTIDFRPGNDTVKSFWRVDTIPKIEYKRPVIPTWQAVTLGLVGGVLVGWLALK